jgi:hypothetical protein
MRKKRALAREKNVIFFKLGAFMYLGEKKCVEVFPGLRVYLNGRSDLGVT